MMGGDFFESGNCHAERQEIPDDSRLLAFCMQEMIQGYWQMSVHEVSREIFTMATTCRLYTPMAQGILKGTAYSEATLEEMLNGLIGRTCFVWVDGIVI